MVEIKKLFFQLSISTLFNFLEIEKAWIME